MSQTETTPSLFERLGGIDGIRDIAHEVVDRHFDNVHLKPRFVNHERDALKPLVTDFFVAGSGGPDTYEGRDMVTAHTGLNLTERELCAALDDALAALDNHGITGATRNEVLAILYSFKDDILYR